MKIIGLTAKKGSGKDTFADYLVENHGYVKLSFAQYIKESAKVLFQWTDEHFEQDKKEIKDEYWNISPREFLQQFGTDFLRCQDILNSEELKIYNDTKIVLSGKKKFTFHIKRLNLHITELYKFNSINNKIVISDIRFEDEYEYVKKLGGTIIKIERSNIKDNIYSQHESETFFDKFKEDYLIENIFSLDSFYNEIEHLLKNKI